jgi:hypothetical protein
MNFITYEVSKSQKKLWKAVEVLAHAKITARLAEIQAIHQKPKNSKVVARLNENSDNSSEKGVQTSRTASCATWRRWPNPGRETQKQIGEKCRAMTLRPFDVGARMRISLANVDGFGRAPCRIALGLYKCAIAQLYICVNL